MSQTQTQVVILDSSTHEDIFVCGVCKLVFNSLVLFINHKKFCGRQNDLRNGNISFSPINAAHDTAASMCPNSEKQSTANVEKNYKDITCNVCKKSFKRLKCLYSHMKLHEQPSQCPVCGRCFENMSHLKRHIATHKVWPNGLNETTPKTSDVELLSYSCCYCDAVLSNYSQFRAHLNNHLSLKKFKCIQSACNGFFDCIEDLLHHVTSYHHVAKYTCHICKKDFFSLEDIGIHYKGHNEGGGEANVTQIHQFKCSQCDAIFRKPEKLSLHLLTESHNKACVHCKKAFASDKRLRMHLQIHKKSKPFQCDICNSSFQMKKYLTSHMLKHGGRQFMCIICKQTFKRQDVLQRHVRTHAQGKRFKCPFKDIDNCPKEFSRKDKLTEHLKSHANQLKSSSKTKIPENVDSGTVEICIVPLDGSSLEKFIPI